VNSSYTTTSSGDKYWFTENGLLHRDDGPAVEYANGDKQWYVNGFRHRENAPAVEYISGAKRWYYNGIFIDCDTQEEFEVLLKLKAFW